MPLLLHNIGYDMSVLKQEGCQLADPPEMFRLLMISTYGDPCTTGCAYFRDGKCPAYHKYHTDAIDKRWEAKQEHERAHTDQSGLVRGKWAGMTIRQIAEREGISLNEARRRKQTGAYAE